MKTSAKRNEYPREDYYLKMQMDCRKVLVGYGRYLEKNKISGQGCEDYENYLNNMRLIENENNIYDFINKLKTEEYKVILYNRESPILEDDIGIVELVLDDLNEDSTVELIDNDTIVIHTDRETIELKGYKNMSDKEIVARKYLDKCEGTLIIKDNEEQSEFRDDNFHKIDIEGYYDKCKDIVDIDIFIGDESDPVWRMNWDAIWVTYEDKKELWQRP